ncbi:MULTISPECIES: hypothetical protein [unclassified Pseudoxanthomonas]|uniref:hypothetical protein n=1 Tax=unclassified Pseudoxanthomonas TaxID=2645906 RepID=UPI003076E08A
MKILFSALLAMILVAPAQAALNNGFTSDPAYTAEVVSANPWTIRYKLTGTGRFSAEELPTTIDGGATFVYAHEGKDVMVHSHGLVNKEDHYLFPYPNYINTDPNHPIATITAIQAGDEEHSFHYAKNSSGQYGLNASFVVTYKQGFQYSPEAVHMQAVYFSYVPGTPFIDVFTAAE